MTPEPAKPAGRSCSKCREPLAEGVNPCPACGAWQRKFSLRTVAHGLTVGNRPEDKTVRKTTAATGTAALLFYALQVFQGEAKAWRESTLAQSQITTQVVSELKTSVDKQTVVFEALNFTLGRIDTKVVDLVPPLAPAPKVKPQIVKPGVRR
jgi:hypothetical protein